MLSTRCDTGKALHHKWAMEVLKASVVTWYDAFCNGAGWQEYEKHATACPQCHAYHVERELARELRIQAQTETQEIKNEKTTGLPRVREVERSVKRVTADRGVLKLVDEKV